MRQLFIGILSIVTLNCQSQELEYKSVVYYFEQVAEIELKKLIEQEILIDSSTSRSPLFYKFEFSSQSSQRANTTLSKAITKTRI